MNEKRFTWKVEKLKHLDDEVLLVVDNENKEWKGHIINIVDKLNELVTKCHRLEKENDRLRQQLKTKVIVNKQYEEKERLKKENRVLKKDLNKLYNLLIDKGMSHNELQDVLW